MRDILATADLIPLVIKRKSRHAQARMILPTWMSGPLTLQCETDRSLGVTMNFLSIWLDARMQKMGRPRRLWKSKFDLVHDKVRCLHFKRCVTSAVRC